MRGGGRAEGSPKDGKLALVRHVSSPASAVLDSNQSHQAMVQRWEGLLLAGGHQNRRFKNPNLQGVMMKSKTFKKRAIIIVGVRKEHTHTQPISAIT